MKLETVLKMSLKIFYQESQKLKDMKQMGCHQILRNHTQQDFSIQLNMFKVSDIQWEEAETYIGGNCELTMFFLKLAGAP